MHPTKSIPKGFNGIHSETYLADALPTRAPLTNQEIDFYLEMLRSKEKKDRVFAINSLINYYNSMPENKKTVVRKAIQAAEEVNRFDDNLERLQSDNPNEIEWSVSFFQNHTIPADREAQVLEALSRASKKFADLKKKETEEVKKKSEKEQEAKQKETANIQTLSDILILSRAHDGASLEKLLDYLHGANSSDRKIHDEACLAIALRIERAVNETDQATLKTFFQEHGFDLTMRSFYILKEFFQDQQSPNPLQIAAFRILQFVAHLKSPEAGRILVVQFLDPDFRITPAILNITEPESQKSVASILTDLAGYPDKDWLDQETWRIFQLEPEGVEATMRQLKEMGRNEKTEIEKAAKVFMARLGEDAKIIQFISQKDAKRLIPKNEIDGKAKQFGGKVYPSIAGFQNDPDFEIRSYAAEIIGNVCEWDEKAYQNLKQRAGAEKNGGAKQRIEASATQFYSRHITALKKEIDAIAAQHGNKLYDSVKEFLNHPDPDVRLYAAETIGKNARWEIRVFDDFQKQVEAEKDQASMKKIKVPFEYFAKKSLQGPFAMVEGTFNVFVEDDGDDGNSRGMQVKGGGGIKLGYNTLLPFNQNPFGETPLSKVESIFSVGIQLDYGKKLFEDLKPYQPKEMEKFSSEFPPPPIHSFPETNWGAALFIENLLLQERETYGFSRFGFLLPGLWAPLAVGYRKYGRYNFVELSTSIVTGDYQHKSGLGIRGNIADLSWRYNLDKDEAFHYSVNFASAALYYHF